MADISIKKLNEAYLVADHFTKESPNHKLQIISVDKDKGK